VLICQSSLQQLSTSVLLWASQASFVLMLCPGADGEKRNRGA